MTRGTRKRSEENQNSRKLSVHLLPHQCDKKLTLSHTINPIINSTQIIYLSYKCVIYKTKELPSFHRCLIMTRVHLRYEANIEGMIIHSPHTAMRLFSLYQHSNNHTRRHILPCCISQWYIRIFISSLTNITPILAVAIKNAASTNTVEPLPNKLTPTWY